MPQTDDKQPGKGGFRKTLKGLFSRGSKGQQPHDSASIQQPPQRPTPPPAASNNDPQPATQQDGPVPGATSRAVSIVSVSASPPHEAEANTSDKIASPFKPAPTHLEEQSQPRIIDDVQAPAILADSDAKPAMEAVRVEIPDGLGVVTATATDAAAGPPVSASQALWDDAFTLIEEDPETKELSEKYLALLDKTLGDGNKGLDSKVTEAGPKPAGAALRQAQMMQLVKAG